MTWYKTTELYTGTEGEMFSDFLLTLDGLGDPTTVQGGWRTGTGGTTNGDVFCQFEHKQPDNTQRKHIWFWDKSSETIKTCSRQNDNYDSSIDDPDNANFFERESGSYESSSYRTTNNDDMIVWKSTLDPSAFFCTRPDGLPVFTWPSMKERIAQIYSNSYILGRDPNDASGDLYDWNALFIPGKGGNESMFLITGYPGTYHGGGFREAEYLGRLFLLRGGANVIQLPITDTSGGYYGRTSEDIVLRHQTTSFIANLTTPQVVYDGSKYFLLFSSNTTTNAWMLDCGAVDPSPGLS